MRKQAVLVRFGLVAAAVLGSLAVASPASADTTAASGYARCPAGEYCLFSGPNGTGRIASFRSGSPDLRGQGIDNDAESEWNRSGKAVLVYTDYNYRGENGYRAPGRQGGLDEWNNVPSSVRVG